MKVTTESVLDAPDVERVLRPRDGLILERPEGDGMFVQAEGPLRNYRRTVTFAADQRGGAAHEDLAAGQGGHADLAADLRGEAGQAGRVTQTVEFQLGLPYFSALFLLPLRLALAPLLPKRPQPWWAPPQRLDRRAAEVLATVCALAVVIGYVGALLSLTMTYAAAEFGASRADQGLALGVVRANVVLALGILDAGRPAGPAPADSRVRRRGGRAHVTRGAGALARVAGALPDPRRGPDRSAPDPCRRLDRRGDAGRFAGVGPGGTHHVSRPRRWPGNGRPAPGRARPPGLAAAVRRGAWSSSPSWPRPAVTCPRAGGGGARAGRSGRPRNRSHTRRLALLCGGGFLFSLFATPVGPVPK